MAATTCPTGDLVVGPGWFTIGLSGNLQWASNHVAEAADRAPRTPAAARARATRSPRRHCAASDIVDLGPRLPEALDVAQFVDTAFATRACTMLNGGDAAAAATAAKASPLAHLVATRAALEAGLRDFRDPRRGATRRQQPASLAGFRGRRFPERILILTERHVDYELLCSLLRRATLDAQAEQEPVGAAGTNDDVVVRSGSSGGPNLASTKVVALSPWTAAEFGAVASGCGATKLRALRAGVAVERAIGCAEEVAWVEEEGVGDSSCVPVTGRLLHDGARAFLSAHAQLGVGALKSLSSLGGPGKENMVRVIS